MQCYLGTTESVGEKFRSSENAILEIVNINLGFYSYFYVSHNRFFKIAQ